MEQNFTKYVHEFFKKPMETYDFRIKTELNDDQSYLIEYSSKDFVIKIENYFREFYASLYKINYPNREINLFNLLEYLKQNDVIVPKCDYFRKEKDIDVCYRKQLNHISIVINDNYVLIKDFFSSGNYELEIIEFEKYWKTNILSYTERIE